MNPLEFLRLSARGGAIVASAVLLRALIGFGTQVALARLLAPEVFGQVAFAATVALCFNAFANLRGDAYVVQGKDSPERAVDVAFTLELIAGGAVVVIVFLAAPAVMAALGKRELVPLVRLLSLSILYNPFCRPRSLLERNLSFVRSNVPFLAAQLAAAGLSIGLARSGYGIWSLLCWRLSVLLGEVLILWVVAPHRPRLRWDPEIARRLARFSWPLVGSAVLSFFCYNVDYFLVGQLLEDGARQLGYYWLGFQAAAYLLMARQVLYDALFPLFSRLDDDELKRQAFLRFSRAVAGVFVVLTVVAVTLGRDLVVAVYGEKWSPAVFPFQVIFIVVMMRAIVSNCGYYLYSAGNTRPELVSVALYAALLAPSAFLMTRRFGIDGTAVAVLAVQVVVTVVFYERYIRPMTAHGVLHFFLWPWIISGLALASARLPALQDGPFIARVAAAAVLLAVAYFAILRALSRDVASAWGKLKAARPATGFGGGA